jgi:hypothetical protein
MSHAFPIHLAASGVTSVTPFTAGKVLASPQVPWGPLAAPRQRQAPHLITLIKTGASEGRGEDKHERPNG